MENLAKGTTEGDQKQIQVPTTFQKGAALYVGGSAVVFLVLILFVFSPSSLDNLARFRIDDDRFWIALWATTVLPTAIYLSAGSLLRSHSKGQSWISLELEARKATLRSRILESEKNN